MKNLFDYATKELSQDAFLSWLFANFNCEQQDVNSFSRFMLCYLITNNADLTDLHQISKVEIHRQYKNIDVLVECTYNGKQYLIVIEDKTSSTEHDEQLLKYEQLCNKNYNTAHIKLIYYKTDIIGWEEKERLQSYEHWKVMEISEIFAVFNRYLQLHNISCFNNEILQYYYQHIAKIYSEIQRLGDVAQWTSYSWHSFFEAYQPVSGLQPNAEIRQYQKQYHYIKLMIKNHERDLPCIEIRHRDYSIADKTLKFRVVLYNVDNHHITRENVDKWQAILQQNGIKLCIRSDISKHKQIGVFTLCVGNTEQSLTQAFDKVGCLLQKMFN